MNRPAEVAETRRGFLPRGGAPRSCFFRPAAKATHGQNGDETRGLAELYLLPQAHRYALVATELHGSSLDHLGRFARAHATVGNFAQRTRPEGDILVFCFMSAATSKRVAPLLQRQSRPIDHAHAYDVQYFDDCHRERRRESRQLRNALNSTRWYGRAFCRTVDSQRAWMCSSSDDKQTYVEVHPS